MFLKRFLVFWALLLVLSSQVLLSAQDQGVWLTESEYAELMNLIENLKTRAKQRDEKLQSLENKIAMMEAIYAESKRFYEEQLRDKNVKNLLEDIGWFLGGAATGMTVEKISNSLGQ